MQTGDLAGYAVCALMAVRQNHVLPNDAVVPLYLWSDVQLGAGPSNEMVPLVESAVRNSLDDFVNQWLRANPMR